MNTDETISTFTRFFTARGHEAISSGSLISPPGDPVLFTSAGMHPLTPYLSGRPHPLGRRLAGVQRCLRTTDLEEVGDPWHLTVFQMLGSWSLGDYDGPQSQRWGLELLCDGFGLKRERLYATVFGGDSQVEPDFVAEQTWGELGLPVERLGPEDNWWSNGPTGPCGPDSEIHVWTGDGPPSGRPSTDDRWLELWNHVTMRYERHPDGSLTPLRQPSVDTGMGLERLLLVSQHVGSRVRDRLVRAMDVRAVLGAVLGAAFADTGRSSTVSDRGHRRWRSAVELRPRIRAQEASAPGADGAVARR